MAALRACCPVAVFLAVGQDRLRVLADAAAELGRRLVDAAAAAVDAATAARAPSRACGRVLCCSEAPRSDTLSPMPQGRLRRRLTTAQPRPRPRRHAARAHASEKAPPRRTRERPRAASPGRSATPCRPRPSFVRRVASSTASQAGTPSRCWRPQLRAFFGLELAARHARSPRSCLASRRRRALAAPGARRALGSSRALSPQPAERARLRGARARASRRTARLALYLRASARNTRRPVASAASKRSYSSAAAPAASGGASATAAPPSSAWRAADAELRLHVPRARAAGARAGRLRRVLRRVRARARVGRLVATAAPQRHGSTTASRPTPCGAFRPRLRRRQLLVGHRAARARTRSSLKYVHVVRS